MTRSLAIQSVNGQGEASKSAYRSNCDGTATIHQVIDEPLVFHLLWNEPSRSFVESCSLKSALKPRGSLSFGSGNVFQEVAVARVMSDA